MTGRHLPCKWYSYCYFIMIKIITIKEIGVLLLEDRLKVYQLFVGKSKFTYTINTIIHEFKNLLRSTRGLGTQFLRKNSKIGC